MAQSRSNVSSLNWSFSSDSFPIWLFVLGTAGKLTPKQPHAEHLCWCSCGVLECTIYQGFKSNGLLKRMPFAWSPNLFNLHVLPPNLFPVLRTMMLSPFPHHQVLLPLPALYMYTCNLIISAYIVEQWFVKISFILITYIFKASILSRQPHPCGVYGIVQSEQEETVWKAEIQYKYPTRCICAAAGWRCRDKALLRSWATF